MVLRDKLDVWGGDVAVVVGMRWDSWWRFECLDVWMYGWDEPLLSFRKTTGFLPRRWIMATVSRAGCWLEGNRPPPACVHDLCTFTSYISVILLWKCERLQTKVLRPWVCTYFLEWCVWCAAVFKCSLGTSTCVPLFVCFCLSLL